MFKKFQEKFMDKEESSHGEYGGHGGYGQPPPDASRGYPGGDQGYGGGYGGGYGSPQPPHGGGYGAPPQPSHGGYGSPHPPPGGGYGAPQSSQPAPPMLPPGWFAIWESSHGRYYFVEEGTGRAQWYPPSSDSRFPPGGPYPPPPGAGHSESYSGSRDMGGGGYGAPGGGYGGHGGGYGGDYGSHGGGGGGYDSHGGQYEGDRGYGEKKDSDKSKMIAAGVGGLAIGAVAGAVVAHEMTEDDNEQAAAAANPTYVQAPPTENPEMYQEELPEEDNDGSSVSSSDREELEEQREELEEAQREYEEAYEETYDD